MDENAYPRRGRTKKIDFMVDVQRERFREKQTERDYESR